MTDIVLENVDEWRALIGYMGLLVNSEKPAIEELFENLQKYLILKVNPVQLLAGGNIPKRHKQNFYAMITVAADKLPLNSREHVHCVLFLEYLEKSESKNEPGL